jgi:uncharacterized membrane protein YgcG
MSNSKLRQTLVRFGEEFWTGILVAVLLLLLFALPAAAREEIRSYTTAIVLAKDGTVTVIETIDANAEGYSIRRGIFRDIPTVMVNADKSRVRSTVTITSITRDGNPEPYSTEGIENGIRIQIGDPDVFLDDGVHRYQLKYTMSRIGRTFPDHDELYFNAIGPYWEFPILRAVATITLPEGAVIGQLRGITGSFGSAGQDVTVKKTSDTMATFRTTRALNPYEGLTVVASFQKGILTEPSTFMRFVYWLSDWRDIILPLIAVALVLLYNLLAWSAVGRDPAKGTIIPLFHAPKGFSPALAHFVHQMGWKNNGWTAFTASIFNLGVKGLVTIDSLGKALSVKVTKKEPAEKLPAGESLLFAYLEQNGTTIVDKTNGVALNTKRGEFTASIEGENRQVYFNNNTQYVFFGIVLSLACLAALVFLGTLDVVWLIFAAVAGVAIGLFTSLFKNVWSGSRFGGFIIVVWLVLGGANLFGGGFALLSSISINTAAIAAFSIVAINVVFGILMRAPTAQGRKVMDQIDGFVMYLETAEKERLNFVGEPQMTVERFEGILPYAIALGVEKPWSKRFEGELARNAVPGVTSSYSPIWYTGSPGSFSSGKISNAVSSAAAGMSAAMIASQPVQSSSSGFSSSGGGGFSGGGGGGGGGGGW